MPKNLEVKDINLIFAKISKKKRKVMATAIRIIPTLQGEEADKFLENAEWTEAHPGSIKVDKKKVELTRKFLREMNLL